MVIFEANKVPRAKKFVKHWIRRLIAILSTRVSKFRLVAVYVGFVVDKGTLNRTLSQCFGFFWSIYSKSLH